MLWVSSTHLLWLELHLINATAINTMATFVHNEPTSLAILQEMQLPQTLYAQLEKEVPSSSDVRDH